MGLYLLCLLMTLGVSKASQKNQQVEQDDVRLVLVDQSAESDLVALLLEYQQNNTRLEEQVSEHEETINRLDIFGRLDGLESKLAYMKARNMQLEETVTLILDTSEQIAVKNNILEGRIMQLTGVPEQIEQLQEDSRAQQQRLRQLEGAPEQIEQLRADSRAQQRRLRQLEGAASHTFAFSAYASTYRSYSDNNVVAFDRVITNLGNGYSTSSNRFTCGVHGLYLFSVTLCQAYSLTNGMEAAIMLEGREIGQVVAVSDDDDDVAEGDQGAITSLVVCSAGQRVWVQVDRSNGAQLSGQTDGPISMFSGVLIKPL